MSTLQVLREHFNTRRRERRTEQIAQWKQTGVYPYQAEPKDDVEKVERAVFDVISGAISPQVPKTKKQAKLTLSLLREAMRRDPQNLATVLYEVTALSQTDLDTLTSLLNETTLSAIVQSANVVANRHKFLIALEHILFDPDDSPQVKERDHLHKLLENELWIFGEAYHLMSTERSLTELLRNHLKLLGLPVNDAGTVRRLDGRTGRTDLHLAAKGREHDQFRHLIVELKAPHITASRRELDQVEDYANTILSNAAFAGDKASWDLMLIVSDYDDIVLRRILPQGADRGLFFDPQREPGRPAVRAYVRRWRDLIDENKRRLEFMTEVLKHDPSTSEGLKYVQTQYADLLPENLRKKTVHFSEDAAVGTRPTLL